MPGLTIGVPNHQNMGMPNFAPPDWSVLLREMLEAGMTQTHIAEAVGLSQASVSDLLNSKVKTTEFSRGLRIIAAHKSAMRRKAKPAAEAA